MVGAGKGSFRTRLVAKPGIDRGVVGGFIPYDRRAGFECLVPLRDPGQGFVVDLDRFGRVHRASWGIGNDHRDGLADMARAVGGQQQVGPDEDRGAVAAMQFHVVTGRGHRAVRNGTQAVSGAVGPGEDPEHTGQGGRPARVDGADAGMRVWRAHHHGIGLALEAEVIAELTAPGDESQVFLASDGLSDRVSGGAGPIDGVHEVLPVKPNLWRDPMINEQVRRA